MSLEGNDPVIGHGGRVSFSRNQGGQPVTNVQSYLWGKGRASQNVFEEKFPRGFANTELSHFLCTDVPGSVRSILIFRGSEFIFGPCGEILYSIETGLAARAKIYGMGKIRFRKQCP